jgi:small subunit ribosomal protein S13
MVKEFDIKRMKQIKSYKGMRHSLKQPVRGQRTRSHFRTTGVAVGVKKGGGAKKK